jgi:CheY-like chemotaxis protein
MFTLPRRLRPNNPLNIGPLTPSVKRGGQRILIVGPSDCLRTSAVCTLRSHGYEVTEARHGEDALRVIEQADVPFHLVVTELAMPVMSGYKLGRRLARQCPELRILYVSLTVRDSLVGTEPLSGRTRFLRKPFRPEELVRAVTESLPPSLPDEDMPGTFVELRQVPTWLPALDADVH